MNDPDEIFSSLFTILFQIAGPTKTEGRRKINHPLPSGAIGKNQMALKLTGSPSRENVGGDPLRMCLYKKLTDSITLTLSSSPSLSHWNKEEKNPLVLGRKTPPEQKEERPVKKRKHTHSPTQDGFWWVAFLFINFTTMLSSTKNTSDGRLLNQTFSFALKPKLHSYLPAGARFSPARNSISCNPIYIH